jgi:transposase-like protein
MERRKRRRFTPEFRAEAVRLPQAGEEGASVAPEAALGKEPKKERMPRVEQAKLLRRTFAVDVFTCAWCGGRRRVLAYVTAPGEVRAILEHLRWDSAQLAEIKLVHLGVS